MAGTLGGASARYRDGVLTVSTGQFERTWLIVPRGLGTRSVRDVSRSQLLADVDSPTDSDFDLPMLKGPASLTDITCRTSDDEGLVAPHLEVVAEFTFAETGAQVRYVVWAFPGAPGLRTQLFVRGLPGETSRVADDALPAFEIAADGRSGGPNGRGRVTTIRAINLSSNGVYKVGAAWKGDGRQPLSLLSTDGEARFALADGGPISSGELAAVPASVLIGNVFVLSAPSIDGPGLDEAWLYERTNRRPVTPTGPADRIRQLVDAAPKGFALVAYWNASQRIDALADSTEARGESLPFELAGARRVYAGYYNDTQHRNRSDTPLLRTVELTTALDAEQESIDWASIAAASRDGAGLAIVKESHKCVNQPGVDTGRFVASARGLWSTGIGSPPRGTDDFAWCWANWSLAFDGTDEGLQTSIKQFDRLRFPHDPRRDEWVKVCTWGHSRSPRDGRNYATEREVLPEMDLAARMGVDLFLIDDGWQVSRDAKSSQPDGGVGWRPHPKTYPDGWKNVIASAERNNLRLAIWGDANHITADEMLDNQRALAPYLVSFKLDFGSFNTHARLDAIRQTARSFVLGSDRRAAISWDVTENAPRVGYYWAREFGPVKLTNRKPAVPDNVVYIPSLVLRDAWQLAHFQNLNKWQIVVHDPVLIDRAKSDAHRYSMSYCLATSLMGVPELFCLPRFMSEASREEVRRLLNAYKPHRSRIFASTVYPIGDEPSGAGWTGFQAVHPDGKGGYLTVLREAENRERAARMRLVGCSAGTTLRVRDLLTGTEHDLAVDAQGYATFELVSPASFLFLAYSTQPTDP